MFKKRGDDRWLTDELAIDDYDNGSCQSQVMGVGCFRDVE